MKIAICSGAGLSAESGIPTFRDSGGLWHSHSIEEVCDLTTFYPNYDKVHDFYNKRRIEMSSVEPNAAHKKIAELSKIHNVFNLTTNVDNLLERAGCEDVIHMHGKITEIVRKYDTEDEEIIDIGCTELDYLDVTYYPLKPNVVFFNEFAPKYQDFSNVMTDFDENDIVIIIGSSEQVFPFIENVLYLCQFQGRLIFVNPDKELCEKAKLDTKNVYQMTSTEFFDNIDEHIPELNSD